MAEVMLKRSQVEAVTGLSRSSIYRLMRRGLFPEPIKIGMRAVRWPASTIDDFLAGRPRASGEGGN